MMKDSLWIKNGLCILVLCLVLGTVPSFAQSTLLYLELQGIMAYSTAQGAIESYSQTADDVMQKPGLGFDLVQRFSGKTSDYGVLAIQTRLAYDPDSKSQMQLQLYNAYFRYKAGFADLWAGHNRPALGLDSELDSHALLLPSPAMMGYGFDRDWGLGIQRDFSWGNAAASLTTGSGMPLYFRGNYLAAIRVSLGVLARDNYSLGVSLAQGDILETVGYHLTNDEPVGFTAVAADATYLWRNLENRFEVLTGQRAGSNIFLLFWRSGVNLLGEGRLKLEVQPIVQKDTGRWDYIFSGGAAYQVTADLAARSMIQYGHAAKDARFVLQIYFYKRV
jgi:hypothetical protein